MYKILFASLLAMLLVPAAAVLSQTSIPAPPDVAAPPEGAEVTETGLASIVLEEGTGTERPDDNDVVKVHYTGWTTDGKMFDSSVAKGEPVGLPMNRVITGWSEGLQLMVVGEKRRFWIPEDLAYKGEAGKPAGMLVFDVELLNLNRMESAPAVPEDVAAAPASAEVTDSGLASRVLQQGSGTEHPKKNSNVTVHYTGWTTDGKMFDSSVLRGKPSSFGLNQVITGWTEGVQLMVVGEKRRFWIPQKLAYGGRDGSPKGMLVFDVELISIN